MARLVAPNGAVVEVRDEKAETLRALGFTTEEPKKSTRRKAKSSDDTSK